MEKERRYLTKISLKRPFLGTASLDCRKCKLEGSYLSISSFFLGKTCSTAKRMGKEYDLCRKF